MARRNILTSSVPVCSIGAFDGALTIGSNLQMTVLDPTGQIKIDRPSVGDRVFVRLPLAVPSETWLDEFKRLAQTKDFWADVSDLPEGTFLTVSVPAAASREETAELLDAALRLIDEAQALANAGNSRLRATRRRIDRRAEALAQTRCTQFRDCPKDRLGAVSDGTTRTRSDRRR